MGRLTGTKTLNNIMNCIAGEAQARGRYNMYAKYARRQGYMQIGNIFDKTAANEYEHFKVFYRMIANDQEEMGDAVMVEVADPLFPVALNYTETHDNLLNAAQGERQEWQEVYANAAKVAEEEGLMDIAKKFTQVSSIEKDHEARFLDLAKAIDEGTVFKKPESVKWICLNCGYIAEGKEAPQICPACKHPQGYFAVMEVNY